MRQEDLLNSLHGCLGKCERALDAKLIEWECLDTSQASPALVINPSSPRAANAVLYDEATTQLVSERDGELLAFFGYNATGTAEADRWRAHHRPGHWPNVNCINSTHQMRVAYHQYRLVYEGVMKECPLYL